MIGAEMKYKPGDLVINAGQNTGLGYIWKVVRYLPHPEPLLELKNLRALRPHEQDRTDSHIGGTFQRLESDDLQRYTGEVPPWQMPLF